MLNLSDKELDRFSQEAAQEYEPGDVLGPRSWERLEARVTQEFGRPGWNPIRHIRRFPFYYAPALMLLLGVGYYFVRPGVSSGSSPGATTKTATQKTSVSSQNSVSTDKATSTPATSTPTTESSAATGAGDDGNAVAGGAAKSGAAAGGGNGVDGAATAEGNAAGAPAGRTAGVGSDASGVDAVRGGVSSGDASRPKARVDASGVDAARRGAARGGASDLGASGSARSGLGAARSGSGAAGSAGRMAGGAGNVGTGGRAVGSGRRRNGHDNNNNRRGDGADRPAAGQEAGQATVDGRSDGAGNVVKPERELRLSYVQRPGPVGKRGLIGDSALRAFNAKSSAPMLVKKKGVYEINRKWQFGLKMAPDFTSVNSLAGDKAGSSIGLTVDYVFAPRWYLSTGILVTRKNYAARNQDYHAPPDFYQRNNIYGGVSFVKGSFYMMEIPLNLRYDFSFAGNTSFFISAGTSSYFMTTENANLYWRHLTRDECSSLDHLQGHRTNLFSTINLSAGVETGLSNSLSLVVAPYMKLPAKNMGLGQVQMNSVGIDFILKWAPVTGRGKR